MVDTDDPVEAVELAQDDSETSAVRDQSIDRTGEEIRRLAMIIEELKQKEEEKQAKEERQKELLRNFLSKFPPKRIPNCHEILEEERRQFMQARKEANRKYTEISANSNKPGKFKHLQFMIYEGNNSDLIRRVMQSRLAGN